MWFVYPGISTSKDLINIRPFGESKWLKLLAFYKKLGFKYELPDTIFPDL